MVGVRIRFGPRGHIEEKALSLPRLEDIIIPQSGLCLQTVTVYNRLGYILIKEKCSLKLRNYKKKKKVKNSNLQNFIANSLFLTKPSEINSIEGKKDSVKTVFQ